MLEALVGTTSTLSTCRVLLVGFIDKLHVLEDLDRSPIMADWLGSIRPESWMPRKGLPGEA